ncbi:molybdopterin-containing oxidoreductase family protein [Pusillimonas noertemannii]|uniref:molybdopterin-containing oxidoreductase family protein n=1 Tax=Pusillimonas noertemannii TaxID=305977 RepID=UPI0003652384|nr:molybdopterin-dependent oxidoreductase [Pusillimonas noertemannii]
MDTLEGARDIQADGDVETFKVVCRMCHGGCGTIVKRSRGKIIEVAGDPDHPVNHGKLCSKAGQPSIDQLYHKDRLNYPLIRAGERGDGQWRQATWDEALDHIAARLLRIKQEHGAEAISFFRGMGLNNTNVIARLANLLGTPNLASISYFCYAVRVAACKATATGKYNSKAWDGAVVPDFYSNPHCIVEWGSQKRTSNDHGLIGHVPMTEALRSATTHIVVDPRWSSAAGPADIWLPLRPGTDAAMALGWINLIIEEGLYDKQFVEQYSYGFEELRERASEYPLSKVADITWCDPEQIARAARLYALAKPACLVLGNGTDHLGLNTFQAARSLFILMGLTGNIDVPGGNIFYSAPPLDHLSLKDKLPPEQGAKRIGGSRFKGLDDAGWAHPTLTIDAILSDDPYPVRAMVAVGTNVLTTYPNTKKVVAALKSLDLLVVHDLFMTPTAEFADVVLPAAGNLERDEPRLHLNIKGPHANYMDVVSSKLAIIAERRSDWDFIIALGRKLGYEEYFPSLEALADEALKPMGMTWAELKAQQYVEFPVEYRKYERMGFGTPTGQFEFYSTTMRDWGYDPLPSHVEPPESPLRTPERYRDFPLVLITGAKQPMYMHSQNRQVGSLRRLASEPLVEMHATTAKGLGIEEGDYAWIETMRGRVRMRAHVHERIHEKVVAIHHGWWLPEKEGPLHAAYEACANILTDDDPDLCDPVFGSSPLKGLLCRVYKSGDEA